MINKHLQNDGSPIRAGTANENLPMTIAASHPRTPMLDNLSGFFTRRRQGRMGLYLPLVHIDTGD